LVLVILRFGLERWSFQRRALGRQAARPEKQESLMACNVRNLHILCYSAGFTMWLYKPSADTLEDCAQPGFFADAADLLTPNDMIVLHAPEGVRISVVRGHGKAIALAPLI